MSLFSNLNATASSSSGGSSLFANTNQPKPTPAAAPSAGGGGGGGGGGGSGLFATPSSTSGGAQPTASGDQQNKTSLFGAGTSSSGLFANKNQGQTSGQPSGQTSGQGTSAPSSGQQTSQSFGQTTQPSQSTMLQNSAFASKGPQISASKNEPPVYTSTKEKYIKACQVSNQYLFDLIVDPNPTLSAADFKAVLDDKIIREKISQGLKYYKDKGQTADQVVKEMNEKKLKWPGKIDITAKGQELVKRASEKLNLNGYQTFNLFELYFEFDKPLLDKISGQTFGSSDLAAEIAKLEKTIINQYYKERINLLECIYQLIIFATSKNLPKEKEPIKSLVNDLIKGKSDFITKLWGSYEQISESNVPTNFDDIREREEWILQNLKEEFYILKIFYILFYELEQCGAEFFLTMIKYFQKQSFLGSFNKHERQITIKSIFLQKQEYATMIADLCVLTLLNCFSLNSFERDLLLEEDEEEEPINPDKNPLLMIRQKGKDITDFFNKNQDNRILTPIIITWIKLIDWYKPKVKDQNIRKALLDLKVDQVSSEDYLSFIVEMKDRPIFVNANKVSLCLYRSTIKSWVCLLSQGFEAETIFSYERLVDICCECLKEKQNLDKFWNYEFRYKTSIATLLFELLKMFPFREAKLIKLVTTLLGDKRHNYVNNVLRLLRNLDNFSCKSSDIIPEDINLIRNAKICEKEIRTTKYISIPAETRVKVIYGSEAGERQPTVLSFSFSYNFWNILYRRWVGLLSQITGEKVEFSIADLKLIKLVCKIIIFDNTIVDVLEGDLISNEVSGGRNDQAIGVPLLLLNTLYYFQSLPQMPQKIIAYIFKALSALQAHPSHSTTLAALIQLYPRTINQTRFGFDTSSIGASRSMLRNSMTGISGYKVADTGVHPILNVFCTPKKFDKLMDRPEKSYDTIISLLKFTYELVVSNEFIFDQYPTEKFIKTVYGQHITSINKQIQRGAELLVQAQKMSESSRYEALRGAEYIAQAQEEIEALRYLQNFIKAQENQSLLYSSFIDDLFNLIYKHILDGYEKMIGSSTLMDKKWKIGTYLFKITEVLLQKFLVNLERVMIISENMNENPLLLHTINHLNNSRMADFIVKTLEVVIKSNYKGKKSSESFSPLNLENKYWMNFIFSQDASDKEAQKLREMIANCLSCLETIVNLIEIYSENRSITGNNSSLLYQTYVSKLNIIDTFEKLLAKKELIHFYVNNETNQSVKINIILALFSYVNFDVNKGLSLTSSLDPQIEKVATDVSLLKNSLVSEEEQGEIGTILAHLDPVLTKNIILKSKLKNNQRLTSVSTLALRILTKLTIIWEDQMPQRKPVLYEYITLISHPDPQFTSNNIIKTVVRELLCIFVNFEAQFDDACALLEMMIVCLHSQRNFVDLFLKNTANYSLYQQDSFLNFVKGFFSKDVQNYKPLLTKLIIFLSEVFQRETRYSSFVQAIRTDTNLINKIFTTVFENFKPNYSLSFKIGDYCNLNSQDLKVNEVKELAFQLEKLTIETLVSQECSNIFSVVVAIRFLTQELMSSGKNVKKEDMKLATSIKDFFSKYFMSWLEQSNQNGMSKLTEERAFQEFLENLTNPAHRLSRESDLSITQRNLTSRSMIQERDSSFISNSGIRGQDLQKGLVTVSEFKRYQRRKQKQKEQFMDLEKENLSGESKDKLDSILLKSIYKILDINLYGYGKNFLYDTQEFYFAMRNGNYKKEFTYYGILLMTKQNLLNSLVTLEHKYFESMISLFKLVSTLGLSGQSFSSSFYNFSLLPADLYNTSLEDVFESDKEKVLANSNYKIKFPFGFPDFFTKVSNSDALEKKVSSSVEFLVKVVSNVWKRMQEDSKEESELNWPCLKALEQNANFLSYAFNAIFYLIKIAKSLLNVENKPKKNSSSENKMEREKEIKLPQVLEATSLKDVLMDIFVNLCQDVWIKIINHSSESPVDMSPYVVLEMILLQCIKEISGTVRIKDEIINLHLETLEHCIQDNISYLSLITTCFEILFTLNSEQFFEYSFSTQSRLLKYLIIKLNAEGSSDLECIFILKFFVKFAEDANGAIMLKDNNIIWELCSNRKIKEGHQTDEYKNGQRNPQQILWCWTLILMRKMIEKLHDETGFINLAISFLKEYSSRINYIISLPEMIFRSQSFDSSNRDESFMELDKTSNVKFTLAYFEELECTTALIFEYFQYAESWITINRLQFELILYNITHCSLKLFKSMNSIINSCSTITPFEKILEQIESNDKKGAEPTKPPIKEVTIPGSPFKGPHRKSFLGTDTSINPPKDVSYSPYDAYNLSVYAYKIEISLMNTLAFLAYSIKMGLQYSELYNYFEDSDLVASNEKKIGIKYEWTYWDNLASTLDNLQAFLIYNYQKWEDHRGTLDKISKKFDYLNNSVTSTLQSFCLNMNFESINAEGLKELAKTTFSILLYNNTLHYSMFKEFKGADRGFVEGQYVGNNQRITNIIEKWQELIPSELVEFLGSYLK